MYVSTDKIAAQKCTDLVRRIEAIRDEVATLRLVEGERGVDAFDNSTDSACALLRDAAKAIISARDAATQGQQVGKIEHLTGAALQNRLRGMVEKPTERKKCRHPECNNLLPLESSAQWHDGFGNDYCSKACAEATW